MKKMKFTYNEFEILTIIERNEKTIVGIAAVYNDGLEWWYLYICRRNKTACS